MCSHHNPDGQPSYFSVSNLVLLTKAFPTVMQFLVPSDLHTLSHRVQSLSGESSSLAGFAGLGGVRWWEGDWVLTGWCLSPACALEAMCLGHRLGSHIVSSGQILSDLWVHWAVPLSTGTGPVCSSSSPAPQLLGLCCRPLVCANLLNTSMFTPLLAKPQAYPSSYSLHQCHKAASMLDVALGRTQRHLLPGCFLSSLLYSSKAEPQETVRGQRPLHLT